MSDKKIEFTKAMREHLMQQWDYYASLTPKITATGAHYLLREQDVKNSDAEVIESGSKVQIRFAIDDDKNPATGWVKMRDSFGLSWDGRRVISFERKFQPNEKATSALWKSRLNTFRSAPLPSQESQQKFVDQVLTKPLAFGRIKASPEAIQFMVESGAALQQGLEDKQMQILPKELESYATVEKLEKGYKIKITWVLDNDGDAKNGRYLMEDSFVIDSEKNFKSHTRNWAVHPDAVATFGSTPPVKLFSVGKPAKALAKAFVDAIVPGLFTTPPPEPVAAPEPHREMVRIDPITVKEGTSGTGKALEVAGPRVRGGVTAEEKPAAKAMEFSWSFSQRSSLERNADASNGAALVKQAIGPYVREQLMGNGFEGNLTLRFLIDFNGQTGHVSKVTTRVEQLTDGFLGGEKLRAICYEAARRIQINLRATASLAPRGLETPQIFKTK